MPDDIKHIHPEEVSLTGTEKPLPPVQRKTWVKPLLAVAAVVLIVLMGIAALLVPFWGI